jgi:hypothetical protein
MRAGLSARLYCKAKAGKPDAGNRLVRFETRPSMRLQSFLRGAMLVLLLGLGVWVALQYVAAPVEKARSLPPISSGGAVID